MINLTKFSDDDLKTLWQATWAGLTKRQMMELMGYTEKEYMEAFHQARLKFTTPIKAPRDKPKYARPPREKNKYPEFEATPVFKRPKAEYSNHSPMRIASPGIIRQ